MSHPLTLGATLLALVVPAQHHSHLRPGCHKLYTIPMTQRAARATFRGTRTVALAEYKRLGRMEMCQRNPRAQHFVRWYDRHQRRLWRDRREATLAPALSPLARCIINAESTWRPYAVNGGHMGYGQWDESTWLNDGGGRYGATPLDATPAEQERIIEEQVEAGNTRQWTDYDPC